MEVRRSIGFVALLLVSACSGASTTELFDPVDQSGSPTAPIVGMNDGNESGSSSSGGATSSGGSSSGGSSSGSTATGSSSGGTSSSGGANADAGAPAPACVSEKEPNDGPEMTEWFTECFSGSLKKGDIDYASISAPQNAKRIEIKHSETGGEVRYRLYINGLQFGSFSGDAPSLIPVFGGGTYSFEMSPNGQSAATRNYELHVTFE